MEPGSPEWRALITASKVPAILGVSPYSDAYTVYHEMKGNIPGFEGNNATKRGTYLEPAILAWFADEHPELAITANKDTVLHPERPTWACTPDGYIHEHGTIAAIVEAKSYKYSTDFGKPGTGEVPSYVLAQVAFQLIVVHANRAHIPVMFGDSFDFTEYTVHRSDVEHLFPGITRALTEFESRLADNDAPEPVGPAGYDTARALHKDIEKDTEKDIPADLAAEYIDAVSTFKAAETVLATARARMAQTMGTAHKATWGGETIAVRKSRSGGTPYVEAARTLPATLKENAA